MTPTSQKFGDKEFKKTLITIVHNHDMGNHECIMFGNLEFSWKTGRPGVSFALSLLSSAVLSYIVDHLPRSRSLCTHPGHTHLAPTTHQFILKLTSTFSQQLHCNQCHISFSLEEPDAFFP
jgi:hypothetical protein